MKVIAEDIWLCTDCMIVAVNGDYSGLDYHYGDEAAERAEEIDRGLEALGPHLVPAFDSETGSGCDEFSSCMCDCCKTRLAGSRHEFALLGD